MRREFRLRRWPVAGPLAWPVIMAANTIGGALMPVQLVDLTDALTSLARLVSSDPDAVFEVERTAAPMAWRDDISGAALAFEARFTGAERPWAAPVALSSCLPSGPGAEPAAVLAKPVHQDLVADGTAVVERFRDWLAGQAPATSPAACSSTTAGWRPACGSATPSWRATPAWAPTKQ